MKINIFIYVVDGLIVELRLLFGNGFFIYVE